MARLKGPQRSYAGRSDDIAIHGIKIHRLNSLFIDIYPILLAVVHRPFHESFNKIFPTKLLRTNHVDSVVFEPIN